MEIKVLGTGCTKCKKLEQLTKETIAEMGIEANIEKVEDIYKIMQYGVMRTPGLVIDDKVVLTGRLPKSSELKDLLTQ
ncbi:MAG: thioredoxin family protein [Bacteroidota bacterium]